MDNKTVIILCLVILLCVVIGISAVFVSAKETQLSVDLSEINQGDNLTITLTDVDGNPLVNKRVHVTVNGVTYNLTTDGTGCVQLPIGLAPGSYDLTVTFDGELLLKSSSIKQSLNVLNTASGTSSSSQSSGNGDLIYNEKTHSWVSSDLPVSSTGREYFSDGSYRETYEDGYFRVVDSNGHLVNYGFA